VPDAWNGVLLNDLDYAGFWETLASRQFLLSRGYALSGSSRIQWDIDLNMEHQLAVLDLVEREFGAPQQTVQIGCSGGGTIALLMAERHPDRVDGCLALAAASSAITRRLYGDFLFVLRALLAPGSDLLVVDTTGVVEDDVTEHLEVGRWDEVIVAAQTSSLGRARIALAVALCQYPTWASERPAETEPPDPADLDEVQGAMFDTARIVAGAAVRYMLGTTGHFDQDVDYLAFYDNADPEQKRTVDALYSAAGADLAADLRRIADADRVVDSGAPDPADAHSGRPRVPTLHVSTMDALVPPVTMSGYAASVRQYGLTSLYRQAFIERANHCVFGVSETATLVDTLVGRVRTGVWEEVDSAALNARAAGYGVDDSRFIDYRPPVLNRAIFADG
jgi:pimeloyl-ACP methyl ester carboxylesterase